jgi:hypothetical protein
VQNVDPAVSLLFSTKACGYVGHSTLQRELAIEPYEDALLCFENRAGRKVGLGRRYSVLYKFSKIVRPRGSRQGRWADYFAAPGLCLADEMEPAHGDIADMSQLQY